MAKNPQDQIAALKTRIAADTTKLAELEAAVKAAALVANLAKDDIVSYPFGRGETRKSYTGVVAAVYETDKGKKVKVLVGEGADLDVHVIDIGAITAVGEAGQEADAPLTASQVGLIGGAAADPLANIE